MAGSHLLGQSQTRAVVVKPVRDEAKGEVPSRDSRAGRELGWLFSVQFGQRKYKPLVLEKYGVKSTLPGMQPTLYLLTVKDNGLA